MSTITTCGNTELTLARPTTFVIGNPADTDKVFQQMEAAKKAWADYKEVVFKSVRDYLLAHPGEVVTCKDVAQATGFQPTQVGSALSAMHSQGIRHESVTVTRKFAEIDENGQMVDGGEVKEIRRDFSGYRAKTKADRW